MRNTTFFTFLFFISLFTHAQINPDSLWGVWKNESVPDSSRAKALNDIAKYVYLYSQPDSAFYYAEMAFDFSRIMGLKKEMANALNTQAGSFYVRGDFHKALEYYQLFLDLSEEISDKKSMAKALNNMGVMYSNLGEFAAAMKYHRQSFEIKEEISDKSGMAGAMNNIGLIYMNHGDYPKALNHFQRSLEIKEEFSDKRGIGQILNNIGLIYMRQGDYLEAEKCFNRSLNICKELSDKKGVAGILSNIGLIYMNQKDYIRALDFYMQSLLIQEEISEKKGMASTFNNIGEIYLNQEDYTNAMEYFQESLKIYEEISDKRGLAGISTNIGRIYNLKDNHSQAILWCDKGLQLAKEVSILAEQKNACECLYDAQKALGNANEALEYHEQITLLNDSLQAEETSRKLQQMEFARQMLADSLLREKEKLSIQLAHEEEVRNKNRVRNIFIFSAILLLIGALAIHRRMVYTRRAKKAIETEKDRSDKLLLNILPAEIANELKEKGKAEARKFEKVSILFTDFKEFTQLSEKLSAEELVTKINACFEKFDSICKKYGIEKIKTIGDSYMAAGGLPVPSEGFSEKYRTGRT